MDDTDIRGLPVIRTHRVTAGSPLHEVMGHALDHDVTAFTASHLVHGRGPALNFGSGAAPMSFPALGGAADTAIMAALDALEAADRCERTDAEAVLLELRAEPRPLGARTGSAYADMCVTDSTGQCSGTVVRWRVSWHSSRRWLTAAVPFAFRVKVEPALADAPAPLIYHGPA